MSKTAILALIATLGTASIATADSYFVAIDDQERDFTLELDLVHAATAGTIEVYEVTSGDLLGTAAVDAGSNWDVEVDLNGRPTGAVNAVLTANGQVLSSEYLRME